MIFTTQIPCPALGLCFLKTRLNSAERGTALKIFSLKWLSPSHWKKIIYPMKITKQDLTKIILVRHSGFHSGCTFKFPDELLELYTLAPLESFWFNLFEVGHRHRYFLKVPQRLVMSNQKWEPLKNSWGCQVNKPIPLNDGLIARMGWRNSTPSPRWGIQAHWLNLVQDKKIKVNFLRCVFF